MDHLNQPYVGFIRDAANLLYRVAWAPCRSTAVTFVKPTIFRSNRYDPSNPIDDGSPGAVVTEHLVWSPYRTSGVPVRVCSNCYIGDDDWFLLGDWDSDSPPVVLADDGFGTACIGGIMPVTSVGVVVDYGYVVSGSPVTSRGLISFDRISVPMGYSYTGPMSGEEEKPNFKPHWPVVLGAINSELGAVTALFGLYEWSPGQFAPEGTIFWAGIASSSASYGPWVSGVGEWVRPAWWPSGMVFSVPVCVWNLANAHGSVGDVASLIMVSPHTDINGTTPWTVDTDAPPYTDYPVPPPGISLDPLTWIGPTVLVLGTTVDAQLVAQNNHTFHRGPVTGGPLTPTWDVIDVTDLPSGYPYSDLSGAPSSVTVSAGTNVTVTVTGSDYEVSVPTYPYGDLTGVPTPPSVSAGANVSVTLVGTDYNVSVATFPLTDCTGTLPATQVSSGYPYSDLSGVPSPGAASSSGDQTIAVVTTGTTVLALTATHDIVGNFEVTNLTAGTCTLHITSVDAETGSHTGTIGFGGVGSWTGVIDCASGILAIVGSGRGPYTSLTMVVTTTSNGNVRVRWGAMLL